MHLLSGNPQMMVSLIPFCCSLSVHHWVILDYQSDFPLLLLSFTLSWTLQQYLSLNSCFHFLRFSPTFTILPIYLFLSCTIFSSIYFRCNCNTPQFSSSRDEKFTKNQSQFWDDASDLIWSVLICSALRCTVANTMTQHLLFNRWRQLLSTRAATIYYFDNTRLITAPDQLTK